MTSQSEINAKNQPEKLVEVKEKRPTDSLVDSLTGIFTSVLKVKDLRSANAAIQEAQKLKDRGESDKARDMVLAVFGKLKSIGKSDELPARSKIEAMVSSGDYDGLARMVESGKKDIQATGDKGSWKQAADGVEQAENSLRSFAKEKVRLEGDLKRNESAGSRVSEGKRLLKESSVKMNEKSLELAQTEAKLNITVVENVERLLGELVEEDGLKHKRKLKKGLKDLKMDMLLSERAELSISDVKKTREKLAEVWQEMVSTNADEMVGKVVKGKRRKERHSRAKIRWTERFVGQFVDRKAAAVAVTARSRQLAEVMMVIEHKLEQGVDFDRTCAELSPEQVRPIQEWLFGMGKKEGQAGYDPVLSELTEELLQDPEANRLLARFMKNVDVGYYKYQEQQAATQMRNRGMRVPGPEVGGYVRNYEDPMIIDPVTGRPVYGRSGERAEFDQGGVDFLRDSWEAPWVKQLLAAKTEEEKKLAYEAQRVAYRQEMMNVNFESLANDVPELAHYLDLEAVTEGNPVRMKVEYRNNEVEKEKFQKLWLQQMMFEQRMIAYEGVFQGANQDARITRYNTLMQIMDVGTELKGLAKNHSQMFGAVDKQQNSFLNEDGLTELVGMWVGQGPDFRLEDMLKEHREKLYVFNKEGKRIEVGGDVGMYDFVHKLKMRVTAEDRVAFNKLYEADGDDLMPENMSRHYGTMMLRRVESGKRTADRKLIFFSVMKDLEIDVDSLEDYQRDFLFSKYQSYLDMGINYLWTHKELHQAVGNASFKKNKYELPQGLPEMLYKADPKLVMDYFRIYSVGGASKDAWVFGDSGMRDHITMATKDFANHLLYVDTTTQGAPGALKTFFGGREENRKHAEFLTKAMGEAIFHHGYFDKENMVSLSTKIGDKSNMISGTRLPDAETIDRLRDVEVSEEFVRAIEWGTAENPGVFAKIVKNPQLVAKLTSSELSAREKWNAFIGRYGEDYYSTTTANAKRMDHFTKYGLKTHFKWYAAQLAWQAAPTNNAKALEALQPSSAVNAGITPNLVDNFMLYTNWANQKLGRKWLGGKKTVRVKRDADDRIQFRTDVGMLGEGDSEWPMMAEEELVNDSSLNDPIQKDSVNGAANVGGYEDELAIKNLLEDFQRAGMYPPEKFAKYVKEHIYKSYFWGEKQSPLVNLWRIATLDVFFEYMGNVWFNLPGHLLREAWKETTDEELKKIWKYFST